MMGFGNSYNTGLGLMATWFGAFLVPIFVWSIAWKGWALWKAAREENKIWFVLLLFLNTLGILDILYIFVFSKKPERSLNLNSKKTSKRK